jgi:hypothetical protein
MRIGALALTYLREYSSLTYAIWLFFPQYGLPVGFTPSHAVLIVVVVFLMIRRRFREIAFGLGTFLALLAPLLFVKDHTHSFHLYVPALGTWFLAAVAIEELLVRVPSRRTAARLLAGVALVVFVVSAVVLRRNTVPVVGDPLELPRSFVLRRAVIAERMGDDLLRRTQLRGKPGRLVLVYPYPEFLANWRNVHAALGQGSGVRLLLQSPNLDVLFVPPADPPLATDPTIEVMIYTELGRCYTVAEVQEAQRRRAMQGGDGMGGSVDSTRVPAPGAE